jgi:subtilase family serine protease
MSLTILTRIDFMKYMETDGKKVFTVTLIFILVISSLAIADTGNNPTVRPVNNPGNSNGTSPVVLAYVPSSMQPYVGKQLNSNGIPYVYYGNLLNVNDSHNQGKISYIFSMLNSTLGIKYFIFNSSQDFTPYVQSPAYLANPYTPSQIYNAYDMNYMHNKGYYGNNTTIVIVDAYGDPAIGYDVSAFDNATGLPPINLNVSTPEGAITSTNSKWASETAIDVEWAHAMAPGAKIDLVLSPGPGARLLDSVAYSITHKLGNVISLSWGGPESKMSTASISELNSMYKLAAQSNITVVAASGDQGANDGTSSKTANFPASDPYVLGVGGTTLTQKASGKYTQTAWGGTVNGKVEGSGGGFSSYFSSPYYQVAPNYTESKRGVPDVSLDANPNTGVLTIINGKKYTLGGTSIATPMWAGIIAIMDQYYNRSMGFVNPLFYKISETKYYTNAFTQITSGGNSGYSAGPGWNPVTGLGTPQVSNLINDSGLVMNGYGTVATLNNTTYANYISAEINVSGNSVEQYNGSTFYYLGFYENQNNYIKFGIMANTTGYYYKYAIYENGTMTEGIMRGSQRAYMRAKISGSEIYFSVNNSTIKEVNIPLVFAGNYRAAMGSQQDNAKINFVNIPNGTYSSIAVGNNSGPIKYTGIYQAGYSNVGTAYSNITFSYNSSGGSLTTYMGNETNRLIYGHSGPTHILYKVKFGDKSTATFRLSNGSLATYTVNGSAITSLSGGNYTVTASSGGKTISRTIYIPFIKTKNVTVNKSPSYATPLYNLLVDHYFNYTSKAGTISVYELENNNKASIGSHGYYTGVSTGNNITSISLKPEKVMVNVFVSNGNVTVKINGTETQNNGGYHYLYITPSKTNINVTEPGYNASNQTMDIQPGQSRYVYVLLTPDNNSFKEVKGSVRNVQYHYNLSNVNITSGGNVIGYTNQSGQFVLFLNRNTTATFHEYLYQNNTTRLNTNGSPVIYMSPSNVSVQLINFKITYSFPLGFYFAFVSWNKYPQSNFGEYVIAYSNNSLMLNSHTETITTQGTTFAFIPGLTPGKTYYVTVDAYAPNGSFISSNEISVHYSLVSYLINLLILIGIISYIVFIMLFFMRRKKRRKELEDELEFFKYN